MSRWNECCSSKSQTKRHTKKNCDRPLLADNDQKDAINENFTRVRSGWIKRNANECTQIQKPEIPKKKNRQRIEMNKTIGHNFVCLMWKWLAVARGKADEKWRDCFGILAFSVSFVWFWMRCVCVVCHMQSKKTVSTANTNTHTHTRKQPEEVKNTTI